MIGLKKDAAEEMIELGVFRERHSNSANIQSVGLTCQRAKIKKTKDRQGIFKSLKIPSKTFFIVERNLI